MTHCSYLHNQTETETETGRKCVPIPVYYLKKTKKHVYFFEPNSIILPGTSTFLSFCFPFLFLLNVFMSILLLLPVYTKILVTGSKISTITTYTDNLLTRELRIQNICRENISSSSCMISTEVYKYIFFFFMKVIKQNYIYILYSFTRKS